MTLYDGLEDLDFGQLVVSEENRRSRALTVSELLLLDYVRQGRALDVKTAATLIQRVNCQFGWFSRNLCEDTSVCIVTQTSSEKTKAVFSE